MITAIRNTADINKAGMRIAVIADVLKRGITAEGLTRDDLHKELRAIGKILSEAAIRGRESGNDAFTEKCESLMMRTAAAYLK